MTKTLETADCLLVGTGILETDHHSVLVETEIPGAAPSTVVGTGIPGTDQYTAVGTVHCISDENETLETAHFDSVEA